jgi:hypothetical protein
MRKRGWTERDRWEDVTTPRVDPPEFDLIDPSCAGPPALSSTSEPFWVLETTRCWLCSPTAASDATSFV